MSQEALADVIGITPASLSRIENSNQPYNQRQLELMADTLKCSEGDLLDRDPDSPVATYATIFDNIPEDVRDQAAKTVQKTLESFVVDKKKA